MMQKVGYHSQHCLSGRQTRKRTELRIDLNRILRILQRLRQRRQLRINKRAIIIPPRIARISLNTLRIMFHRRGEIALLERFISLLARHSRLFGIDVSFAVGFGFELFAFAELIEDVGGAMFAKRFFEEFDSEGKVAFAGVGGADTTEGFGDEFVVCAELPRDLVRKPTRQ